MFMRYTGSEGEAGHDVCGLTQAVADGNSTTHVNKDRTFPEYSLKEVVEHLNET